MKTTGQVDGRFCLTFNNGGSVAYYGEFVQPKRLKAYGQFGVERTGVSVMPSGVSASDAVEAMRLSMGVRFGGSPPRGNRNGADLGEEVGDGHGLIAMGAWSSGSKSTSENAALVAALLTKEPGITLGALVDDGRPWKAAGKAELELVGRSLSETEATLAASV